MTYVVAGAIAGGAVTLAINRSDLPQRVSRLVERLEAQMRNEEVGGPLEVDAERWWMSRAQGAR